VRRADITRHHDGDDARDHDFYHDTYRHIGWRVDHDRARLPPGEV